ncbi:VOC family protein [Nonomuraea sp. SYSU D8015]|uniref:VOC family protein n=1 Tax=Nonomuraea sp. SYSU D8015 TaxID=2593644 RepID=UPI001CB6FA8F|nr:VOC family protein [Nonomuraea sp. SYSU D8015]
MTIGTSQPRELARFYSRLLDMPVTTEEGPAPGEPEEAGWAQIRAPEGVGAPTLNFEYERHHVTPVWPSVSGGQNASQHLDIKVDDLAEAVEWALGCGAVLADFQPQDEVRVLLDPDGHPFCLFL